LAEADDSASDGGGDGGSGGGGGDSGAEGSCLPKSTSDDDAGAADEFRGWFDIQGCGKCNDYCRWVEGDGSGGDPSEKTQDGPGGSYWSCRLAGSSEAYTEKGKFAEWTHSLCDAEGATSPDSAPPQEDEFGCKAVSTDTTDPGHMDSFRGWYDIQGCGRCNDYCRWVEGDASGGDPRADRKDGPGGSYWSCRMAGEDNAGTPAGHFDEFEYLHCDSQGSLVPEAHPSCEARSSNNDDPGWDDAFRGWYDIQGCGECFDYCRWVNGSASGGNPTESVQDGPDGAYWSCRLAGTTEAYTAAGNYENWDYAKCDAEGSESPEVRRLRESNSLLVRSLDDASDAADVAPLLDAAAELNLR